eukprot:5617301-Pleurochrysis_carterae.AAC.1
MPMREERTPALTARALQRTRQRSLHLITTTRSVDQTRLEQSMHERKPRTWTSSGAMRSSYTNPSES